MRDHEVIRPLQTAGAASSSSGGGSSSGVGSSALNPVVLLNDSSDDDSDEVGPLRHERGLVISNHSLQLRPFE